MHCSPEFLLGCYLIIFIQIEISFSGGSQNRAGRRLARFYEPPLNKARRKTIPLARIITPSPICIIYLDALTHLIHTVRTMIRKAAGQEAKAAAFG